AAGEFRLPCQTAGALGRLLLENVVAERLPTHELAGARDLEALGGTPMCLHLRHLSSPVAAVPAFAAALRAPHRWAGWHRSSPPPSPGPACRAPGPSPCCGRRAWGPPARCLPCAGTPCRAGLPRTSICRSRGSCTPAGWPWGLPRPGRGRAPGRCEVLRAGV